MRKKTTTKTSENYTHQLKVAVLLLTLFRTSCGCGADCSHWPRSLANQPLTFLRPIRCFSIAALVVPNLWNHDNHVARWKQKQILTAALSTLFKETNRWKMISVLLLWRTKNVLCRSKMFKPYFVYKFNSLLSYSFKHGFLLSSDAVRRWSLRFPAGVNVRLSFSASLMAAEIRPGERGRQREGLLGTRLSTYRMLRVRCDLFARKEGFWMRRAPFSGGALVHPEWGGGRQENTVNALTVCYVSDSLSCAMLRL